MQDTLGAPAGQIPVIHRACRAVGWNSCRACVGRQGYVAQDGVGAGGHFDLSRRLVIDSDTRKRDIVRAGFQPAE